MNEQFYDFYLFWQLKTSLKIFFFSLWQAALLYLNWGSRPRLPVNAAFVSFLSSPSSIPHTSSTPISWRSCSAFSESLEIISDLSFFPFSLLLDVKKQSVRFDFYYSVFHRFRQVKCANGGSILSLSQFSLLPQLPQKNDARFKSGQKWLKSNHLATLI